DNGRNEEGERDDGQGGERIAGTHTERQALKDASRGARPGETPEEWEPEQPDPWEKHEDEGLGLGAAKREPEDETLGSPHYGVGCQSVDPDSGQRYRNGGEDPEQRRIEPRPRYRVSDDLFHSGDIIESDLRVNCMDGISDGWDNR